VPKTKPLLPIPRDLARSIQGQTNAPVVIETPKEAKQVCLQSCDHIFELKKVLPRNGVPYDFGFVPSNRS